MSYGRPYGLPEHIVPVTTADVSTLTVLKAFEAMGSTYHTLLFILVNNDASNSVTMTVETSEDGLHPDANLLWNVTCPAGKQVSVEVGPGTLRRYWRLSATSAGPSYPTVSTTYSIRGVHRST